MLRPTPEALFPGVFSDFRKCRATGKDCVEWRERTTWVAPAWGTFSPSAEEWFEVLSNDTRAARTAVSAGGEVAGRALYVGHGRGP